jgi:predicted RNase H-like HicB family nuclease
MKRYLIVLEKAKGNWGAFAPDLPGCVALGDTIEETTQLMQEAIELHLEAMAEDGERIPAPTTRADYVEVEVPAKQKRAVAKRMPSRKKVAAKAK